MKFLLNTTRFKMERFFNKKPDVLRGVWRLMSARARWEVLWLAHDKFIIGVSGVVLNGKDDVLLLQHRFWPEGSWGLPSGYAKRGETFEETIAREIEEETNYQVVADQLLSVTSGYKLRAEITFLARYQGGKLKLENREVTKAEFFPANNLPEGLLPTHRDLINNAMELLSQRKK